MANVRDSDISLWLHNKLGTSNDSWISGSITSQLNKEVLRNIKECFPDLQTQVKLKLLLSFFQIPRRIVEEWKTELEEVIEVAGLDSELWVSMIAETIKTLPTTGSLNTEITDYEETRPIFTDMVNELRRLVVKNADLGMLPLECQYLNKSALVSVVGQQTTPVKHFTLKRKPKSAALRAELLQKSSDAQSCLKKISAPTVPLRSRGIPRKMTDTTPLKGIPSRVPTGGFRSPPTTPGQTRPTMSRTPAGRKDGGIKLLEIGEQPLGYAAAKKRKREQEKEEQAKKVAEQQSQSANDTKPVATTPITSSPTVTTTPDYAAGLSAPSTVYSQPATPMPATSGSKDAPASVMSTSVVSNPAQPQVQQPQQQQQQQQTSPAQQPQLQPPQRQQGQPTTVSQQPQQQLSTEIQTSADVDEEEEEVEMKEVRKESISLTSPTSIAVSSVPSVVSSAPPPLAYPSTKTLSATVIKTEALATGTVGSSMVTLSSQPPSLVRTVPLTPKQAKSVLQTQPGATGGVQIIQKSTGKTISAAAAAAAAVTSSSNTNAQQKIEIISSESIVPGTLHASIPKSTTIINRGGNILFTTKQVQSGTTTAAGGATIIQQKTPLTSFVLNTTSPGKQLNIQRIVSSVSSASTPSLTTTLSRAQHPQQLIQPQQIQVQGQQSAGQSTRIVQIKTAPTMSLNNNQLMQNIPPLISTQMPGGTAQPTILNIQSMQQQQQQQQGQQNQLQITPTAVPQKRTITITAQNPQTAGMTTSVAQILQQQQLQQQQQQQQQALQATAAAAVGQQPKYTQVVMPPNVKGNTFYVTNSANMSNVLNQKGVIIQTVDASGNTVYQQIPLQNVSGLSGATILSGPPGLIKTESDTKLSQIPALVPTSSLHQNIPALTPVVIQPSGGQQQGTTVIQQQQQGATIPALITNISQQQVQQQQQQAQVKQQVIFRPVGGSNNVQTILPQGITLIQRPGGQPKLVQTIQQSAVGVGGVQQQPQLIKTTTTAGQQGQRTIITQIPQQQQQQTQQQHTIQFQAPGSQRTGGTTIQLVQQPQQQGQTQQIQVQRAQLKQVTQQQQQQQGTTVTIQQQSQGSGQQQQQAQQAQQQQAGARKGLSISSKYYMEAHDMFKRANCVSRLEKAIIIGFMAGYRNNPRPSPENVVTIKLNESVEKVHQDDRSTLMLVESLITLDYNTGQWRTFRKYREVDQTQQLPEGVNSDATTTTGTANTAASGGSGTASNAGQQNSVVI
uniref:HDAg domain-containing protein n=1 Tax=Anopheles christyi TaxID=43041 RepID=A0A182K2W4_9DIPT